MGYALRTTTHRYVQWRDFETGAITAHELYDHRTNDGETENIFDKAAPELINKLSTTLLKSHPPKKLSLLPAVHSNPNNGRLPSSLKINNTHRPLRLSNFTAGKTWSSARCARQRDVNTCRSHWRRLCY
jgi:iduronate 2-sulfatase